MTSAAAAALAPIQIPSTKRSPRRTREPSGTSRRQSSPALAVAASVVLVALVAMELWATEDDATNVKEWRCWILQLIFPSHRVTWAKLVVLALGFVLTASYFLSSQAQLASAEKLMIHSANVLVSPLRQSQLKPMTNDPNAPTPTGKTTAAWLASRCQNLLQSDQLGNPSCQDGPEDEIPRLKIRDECKSRANLPASPSGRSEFEAVNRPQPIAFESDYFRGHMLLMVKDSTRPASDVHKGTWAHLFGSKKRMMWVQVQGRFKRPLPPRSIMYLATELPTPDGFQVAFLMRQLVSLLIALVKKFVPSAHIAFGEKATSEGDNELPHAAFPLYQTVDEFVVTDEGDRERTPSFGQEVFGETPEAKKLRAATPVGVEPPIRMDAVYSFQFHTMYADLAQWKIVNVPGIPDMELKRFIGNQPIRLAVYAMATPGLHPGILCDLPHKAKDKGYIFCFSMHHNGDPDIGVVTSPMGRGEVLAEAPLLSPILPDTASPPPSSPLRWRSVSCDQPDSIIRQQTRETVGGFGKEERISEVAPVEAKPQPRIRASSSVRNMTSFERAADLSNWKFSLPVWIERVDPAAGNRKVAYLFVVEEKQSLTSMPVRPARRCVVRSAQTVKNTLLLLDAKDIGEHSREFKKLVVESREFLYETISRETDQLARALQKIAAIPIDQTTETEKEEKAMLFNCLMSESQLPCIWSFQDIGVQLTKAKRDQMDIIFERGIYRMIDPRFLRQEWFILTTTELHFFRSFTMKPGKTIQLSHVLGVRRVDEVPFFEETTSADRTEEQEASSPRQRGRDAALRATNRWFCVEVHVLSEVLTLFFDCPSDRAQCISSLTQLIKLKAGASAAHGWGRLPAPRPIDAVTTPICCNQRKRLPIFMGSHKTTRNPLMVAEEMASHGVRLFSRARVEAAAADVVAFLDSVDQLSEVDLLASSVSTVTAAREGVNELAEPSSLEKWFTTSESRIAFALNLYHALHIHAWLLFGDVRTHTQWKKLKSMIFYVIGNPRTPSAQVRVNLGDIEHILLQGRPSPGEDYRASGPLPSFLMPLQRDFRTSFALQTNADPSVTKTVRVYHSASLSSELDEACAVFLEDGVVVDDVHRAICLPKICEWNADDFIKNSPVVQPGCRAFFCLQKLLPLMNASQHDRIQHVLLGAGKEYQIRFSPRFWTQELRTPQSPDATSKIDRMAKALSSGDLAVAGANAKAEETNDGIPRSKSALQFFQSLF